MADQQIPETKNSDAPGDQDQAAQQAPAEVDGLAAKAEQLADVVRQSLVL